MKNLIVATNLAIMLANVPAALASKCFDVVDPDPNAAFQRIKLRPESQSDLADLKEKLPQNFQRIQRELEEDGDFRYFQSEFVVDADNKPVVFPLGISQLILTDEGAISFFTDLPENKDSYAMLKVLGRRFVKSQRSDALMYNLRNKFDAFKGVGTEISVAQYLEHLKDPWVSINEPMVIGAEQIICGGQYLEVAGDLAFITRDFKATAIFKPRTDLILQSSNPRSPFKQVVISLLDPNYPMHVTGRIIFSDDPIVELATLNAKVRIDYNFGTPDIHTEASNNNLVAPDMHKEGDRNALQQFLDTQLEAHKASKLYNDVQPTINKMVLLWRQENPDFSKSITDEYSSQLVAEAWFWSKNLGLFDVLTASGWDTYDKIRAFQPLDIMHGMGEAPAGLKEKINLVSNKMVAPSMGHEASYALMQAAWTYLASKIGAEEFDKLKALQSSESDSE